MRRLLLLLIAAALPVPAAATETLQPKLRGVPVETIWKTATATSSSWFEGPLQIMPSGDSFVATVTFAAKKPQTGEPLPLTTTWTLMDIVNAPSAVTGFFTLPEGTTMLVVGHFTYTPTGGNVETFAALRPGTDGSLISQDLGLRLPNGSLSVSTENVTTQALAALGIQGPFTTVITLPPTPNE